MDGSAGTGTGNSHRLLDGVHRRKPTKKNHIQRTQHKQQNPSNLRMVHIHPMKRSTSAHGVHNWLWFRTTTHRQGRTDTSSRTLYLPTRPLLYGDTAAAFPDIHNTTADANLMNNNNPSLTVEIPMEDDPFLGSFYDDIDDLIFPPPVIGNYPALLPAAAATAVLYESYAR
ncbi:hypothetical protein SDJN02_03316, partial [Cucurbita argyrosperma subsp. argyrosperma]